MIDRRKFLKHTAAAAVGLAALSPASLSAEDRAPASSGKGSSKENSLFVRPALFWEPASGGRVQCRLCPWQCLVGEGDRGRCGVRENRNGRYHTLVYGRAVALNNDPIEKKPFYHFRPGTMVLSVATAGCNISCKFCQNWQISQFKPEELDARPVPPETMVRLARENGISNLAVTYSEPTVFYEYVLDLAREGKRAGLHPVVVSNGFITPEAAQKLAPHLSAYKIDLKGFTEEYYRDYCGARLAPVLETLKTLAAAGLWLEIVNLVLPTANDGEKNVRAMASWIGQNLGTGVPLHFTRFHPMYKMKNLPPTPVTTLENCRTWAMEEGLKYVYVGNVPGHPSGHTYCPQCGRTLIRRTGMWDVELEFSGGRCPKCQTEIPGVWS